MGKFVSNDAYLTVTIADISSADQVYVAVPEGCAGIVREVRSVIGGAISGADADLTVKVAGAALTNGVITVAQSGSAAGDVDVCYPSTNNAVAAGDSIEIETDGASTGSVSVTLTIVIRR